MAWNPSPKIQDLREIAPKWGYDQMIVLAINSKTGTFETVSYGVTRQLCDEARKINEQIHAKVASGDIEIDAEPRVERRLRRSLQRSPFA